MPPNKLLTNQSNRTELPWAIHDYSDRSPLSSYVSGPWYPRRCRFQDRIYTGFRGRVPPNLLVVDAN